MTSSRFDPGSTSVRPQKPWTSPFYGSMNGPGLKTLLLGRRVRTGLIATHLRPACAQAKALLLKLWSHAHGRWDCYIRVMTGKYNMTTIKEIYLLLDIISKWFSIKIKKGNSTTPRNTLQMKWQRWKRNNTST